MNHRSITFQSLDDVAKEIDRLASGPVTVTGKHDFPSIVRHLAITNFSMSGKLVPPKLPWYMRLIMPLLKSSILNGPVTPGFNLPAKAQAFLWPPNPIILEDAVSMYRDSMAYYKQHGPLPVHPIFGRATRAQIDNLNLRHAAMHLGFVDSDSAKPS
jgi:hypothetical protein